MAFTSYVIAAIALCFALSGFTVIRGDNVDCSSFKDNTTCCAKTGCSFINCTDINNPTAVHKGCHTSGDKAEIDKVCKATTATVQCTGPPPKCSDFTKQEDCCNKTLTKMPECDWVNCTNITTPTANHQGCHNSSDDEEIGKVCKKNTASYICNIVPTPTAVTCTNFTDKSTCCSNGTDLGCIYVNCTAKDKKLVTGCFNKTDVTCEQKLNMCETSTTVKPTTTPSKTTPSVPTSTPDIKQCDKFTTSKDCCHSLLYRCLYVNCTIETKPFKGCVSAVNETDYQNKCAQGTYFDSCSPTTPSPASTTPASAPSKAGRHFDGASFIGGIVLCSGIVLIIFFALKWYRSRQSANNYHQM